MIRVIKNLAYYIFFVVFVALLIGCSSDGSGVNEYSIYLDSNPIENDKIKIEFEKPYCSESNNYYLSIYIKITNKEVKTNEFNIRNTSVVKLSSGAKYPVSSYSYLNNIKLNAELSMNLDFSATIPSSIIEDEYVFNIVINSYKIKYYLYEMPDDLRVDRKVNYYISNKLVKTEVVKDNKTLESLYIYESEDNLTYCNNWFTSSNGSDMFLVSTKINQDINLYGTAKSNFTWMSLSSDIYSYIQNVSHVPTNGILIIPSQYLNKEICISNFAIRNINVSKIYVPKTVHKIYSGNFTGIGDAKIYYEGTEAEWKALFSMSSSIVTTNVVYNTKY